MIEVRAIGPRDYLVRLDDTIVDAIGWGSPELIIRQGVVDQLTHLFPGRFDLEDDGVPF